MRNLVWFWVLSGVALLFCLAMWIGWRFFLPRVERVGGVGRRASVQGVTLSGAFPRFSFPQNGLLRFASLGVATGGGVVVCILMFANGVDPDPLSVRELGRQTHIQGALNPERLVPPPAFPPSFFVGSGRDALETADRDWGRLDSRFLQPVLELLRRLETRGYVFVLLEGYRSPERQEMLADKGGGVTNARAFQSKHQFGLAVDLAPARDGRLVISERDPWAMEAYLALGEEAERAGFVWGGRWWFKDYGHIEARAL